MRVMLVYRLRGDFGSAQDLHNYMRIGEELGHELVVFGSATGLPFNYCVED